MPQTSVPWGRDTNVRESGRRKIGTKKILLTPLIQNQAVLVVMKALRPPCHLEFPQSVQLRK